MQITTLSHQQQQQKVRFPTWNCILGYSFHPHPARLSARDTLKG